MKQHFVISLIVIGLATILATLASIGIGLVGFVIAFGLTCIVGGGICLFLALIMALTKGRKLAQTMLISAGILLLVGTGVCSTVLGMDLQH